MNNELYLIEILYSKVIMNNGFPSNKVNFIYYIPVYTIDRFQLMRSQIVIIRGLPIQKARQKM